MWQKGFDEFSVTVSSELGSVGPVNIGLLATFGLDCKWNKFATSDQNECSTLVTMIS